MATLTRMVKLTKGSKTNAQIIQQARRIVAPVPAKDWFGEAEAIQNWVRDNIRYTRDPYGVETLQTPEVTLSERQGDCDDQSVLVGALLSGIGHPVRYRAVSVKQYPNTLCHVYTETKIGSAWVAVETTENWPLGHVPEMVNLKGNVIRHV